MNLSKYEIRELTLTPFQAYLLTDKKVKRMAQEFLFYNVLFYSEEKTKYSIVYLQYPQGNLYWYLDFVKYVNNKIIPGNPYAKQWNWLLEELKKQIKEEFDKLKFQLNLIHPKDVVINQLKHRLYDYQAFDLLQFLVKYNYWGKVGLILSEQRTGKTRVALAALKETMLPSDVALIVCPKTASGDWENEIAKYDFERDNDCFNVTRITKKSQLKAIVRDMNAVNIRIITYDLFKTLDETQLKFLTSNSKRITFVGDEIHRLRNFTTKQSKAIFDFKKWCKKQKVELGIIGITGTISVKDTTDTFGPLSLINNSKIAFKDTWIAENLFKEYFYVCEDTTFGKKTKALKREQELTFIIQNVSVQTKQKDLEMFKYYTKEYKKIELDMDLDQKNIYKEVYAHMEYDEDINCQNKLVQLTRLQQICIDPYGLVASYALISPKLQWILKFALRNKTTKFIVSCKQLKPLQHLAQLFEKYGIKYVSIDGSKSNKQRDEAKKAFNDYDNIQVILLQQDTGKESLTLNTAQAIIFLNRDYAVGFNEQAEARMTPIDGSCCKKLVIDLVMKDSKEEEIYDLLVTRKTSINAMNLVFKPKEV